MTKETISLMDETDPTLCAIDRAMEAQASTEEPRPYLGMSSIGESCSRKIWYRLRWMQKEYFDAQTLKRFEDGHMGEDLQAKRLRMVEGVHLETVDSHTGQQFGYVDLDGHFRGHCDGKITGILQAPKTPHIWEHKSVGEKKLNELKKIRSDVGQKLTLRKWNPTYWAQAILYMYYEGFTRHYMTISTPGGRDTESLRTDADTAEALKLRAKAIAIIEAQDPPDRISNSPSWFECRWCAFSGVCHGDDMPLRNCRSCLHSTPIENGQWHCARFGHVLDKATQMAGCPAHKFIPKLVPGVVINANDTGVTYQLHNGSIWEDKEI